MTNNIDKNIHQEDGVTNQSQAAASLSGLSQKVFFLTNGNFTVPTGVTSLIVTAVAGGGGGATYFGGGGGSGQGCFRKVITVRPGEIIPIVIGAGGRGAYYSCTSFTGIPGSLDPNAVSGMNGGNTSIGNYINLVGGKGPTTYPMNHTVTTGLGACHGEQASPTLNPGLFNETYESTGWRIFWKGGNGGASIFGAGGTGGCYAWDTSFGDGIPCNGDDAINFGAGGGGGGSIDQHAVAGLKFKMTIGGNGANGIVILEW